MNKIKIPKRTKGEFREICIPTKDEKLKFQSFLPSLNNKTKNVCAANVHGFIQGRSPVTNAKNHLGFRYSLSFDLSDFFDSVRPIHLKGKLNKEEIANLMPEDRAYQGLPTSPLVANLAAVEMDKTILKKFEGRGITYTRYADDLTFSFDDFLMNKFIRGCIKEIVNRCGFRINETKTHLQDALYGSRRITGIQVSNVRIEIPRSTRRKLRAALHQGNMVQARGWMEWAKLKEPQPRKFDFNQRQLNNLLNIWKLPALRVKDLIVKPNTNIGCSNGEMIISGDPIQILGLSNFTNGWVSCMKHPNGSAHKGAIFWALLEGTRIAGITNGKTLTIGDFTRPIFTCRTLIHEMRDGCMYYDSFYGEGRDLLREHLHQMGIMSVSTCKHGDKVKGEVLQKKVGKKPYFDWLSCSEGTSIDKKGIVNKVYIAGR